MAITRNATNGINSFDKFIKTSANNIAPKNLFVAAGNITVSSPDGITWTTRSSGVVPANNAVGVDQNNQFRIFNNTTVSTSPDGISWTTGTVANSISNGQATYVSWFRGYPYQGGGTTFSWTNDWLNGRYIVGDRAVCANGSWVVTTSSSAGYPINVYPWGNGAVTTINSVFPNQAQGVAFGNNIWVATPVNRMYYTTDSSARTGWTNSGSTFGASFNKVKFVNDRFFVFEPGTSGMSYSTDGANWNSCSIGFSVTDVVFGNGLYVATASNGSVGTSTDGINFTTRSTGATSLLGITYA